MTKKDYELIAGEIRHQLGFRCISLGEFVKNPEYYTLIALAEHLANRFKKSNPKFDKQKFFKACGIED